MAYFEVTLTVRVAAPDNAPDADIIALAADEARSGSIYCSEIEQLDEHDDEDAKYDRIKNGDY